MIGGIILRSNAKFMDLKKGCDLISEAPPLLPKRLNSSRLSSFRTMALQLLNGYTDVKRKLPGKLKEKLIKEKKNLTV